MLRASIEYDGGDGQLAGIAQGAKVGDSGIKEGERLTAFADAAVYALRSGESAALDAARDALRDAAGSACVVDAAAVIGNFERMVRIADGTGIPLDGIVDVMSSDFRDELGLNDFQSRRQTQVGFLGRTFGPLLKSIAQTGLRFAGRWSRKSQ